MVHHMIIYKCFAPGGIAGAFECDGMMAGCLVFWTGWAVGAQTNYMPAEAGLAMGNAEGAAEYVRYFIIFLLGTISHLFFFFCILQVVLQVHYDNPNQLAGKSDPGSGFRLTYTDQLRQHDIGVLTLGDFQFAMASNTSTYHVDNECPKECTKKFPHTLNVIGNGFHMHQVM